MTDLNHVAAVARQNPPRKGENALVYLQRLCVLAGVIRPEDTSGEPPTGWHDAAGIVAAVAEEGKDPWWQR